MDVLKPIERVITDGIKDGAAIATKGLKRAFLVVRGYEDFGLAGDSEKILRVPTRLGLRKRGVEIIHRAPSQPGVVSDRRVINGGLSAGNSLEIDEPSVLVPDRVDIV